MNGSSIMCFWAEMRSMHFRRQFKEVINAAVTQMKLWGD